MHRGNILKALIKQNGFTQGKVAEALGYDQAYFSKLLKDQDLKNSYIDKVCAVIGVDRDKHFTEEALASPSELYRKKHDQVLEKYLVEKEQWLDQKKQLLDEMADYIEQIASLKRENIALKTTVEEYKLGKRVG